MAFPSSVWRARRVTVLLTGFHGSQRQPPRFPISSFKATLVCSADTCALFKRTLVTKPGITLERHRAVGFERAGLRVVEGSIEPIQQPAANGGSQDVELITPFSRRTSFNRRAVFVPVATVMFIILSRADSCLWDRLDRGEGLTNRK